jgi:hypothetical protein
MVRDFSFLFDSFGNMKNDLVIHDCHEEERRTSQTTSI